MYRVNLSTEDTIGTQLTVLYREVSLIQRYICTQCYVVETADIVLIGEVPFIQNVLYREVPLYVVHVFATVCMHTVHAQNRQARSPPPIPPPWCSSLMRSVLVWYKLSLNVQQGKSLYWLEVSHV